MYGIDEWKINFYLRTLFLFQLRLMQQELCVEEIVKDTSLKVSYD